jgi:hypothetical protein
MNISASPVQRNTPVARDLRRERLRLEVGSIMWSTGLSVIRFMANVQGASDGGIDFPLERPSVYECSPLTIGKASRTSIVAKCLYGDPRRQTTRHFAETCDFAEIHLHMGMKSVSRCRAVVGNIVPHRTRWLLVCGRGVIRRLGQR